jgi:restriction system protein
MAVPPFEHFMVPVLQFVSDGKQHQRNDVKVAAVEAMNLTPDQLSERIKGGSSRAGSRAHWAIEYLCQSGAIDRPVRGILEINDIGRALLANHPEGVTRTHLSELDGYKAWKERTVAGREERRLKASTSDTVDIEEDDGSTPMERLIEAVSVLDEHTADQLVERIRDMPPLFLEKAVLKLLHAMGYGGSEDDGEHLGRSHDGGIDGVIKQDALGIERVYVQAKRYAATNTVGSAAIREFVGALTGVGASGGVFITTSSFSPDALKYVERLSPRVILIDGNELGRLMVEYGVGVTVTQTLKVSDLDENFFEDE